MTILISIWILCGFLSAFILIPWTLKNFHEAGHGNETMDAAFIIFSIAAGMSSFFVGFVLLLISFLVRYSLIQKINSGGAKITDKLNKFWRLK